ncbi:unnamed protein product [Vicia faba]|uniref:Uncharacterized protein n=1 Tax=Vicia faba TaxID=3906 RepID=A0AAV1A4M7_VICFA|nr:unnamed protein product [Vicia faba]
MYEKLQLFIWTSRLGYEAAGNLYLQDLHNKNIHTSTSRRCRKMLIRNKDTYVMQDVNGVTELSSHTPMLEVINPTSIGVTKTVSQPTHVLQSIPSFDLNFHEESTVETVVLEYKYELFNKSVFVF